MTHSNLSRSLWGAVAASALVSLLLGCGAATLPRPTTPEERVAQARQLATEGDCFLAIDMFKGYIATNSGAADVDQAVYFLGICYIRTKDWASAAIEFERLIRDYPESDSAAAASFMLGEALFGQTRPIDFDQEYTVRAIRQWQGYLRAFPGHWRNPEAEERLLMARTRMAQKSIDTGDLYVKLRLFQPARVYFRSVIDQYGDTELAGDAWMGLVVCDVAQGMRREAIDKLRQIESLFAGQRTAQRAAARRRELER